MKLLSLTLDNLRGAPNGEYAFTHPSTGAPLDTLYITGPAASGKTAFLEAIAALKESIGAYGSPPDTARLLRRGKTTGRIAGTWQVSPEEAARAELPDTRVTASLDLAPDAPPSLADAGIRAIFQAYSHDPAQGKLEYFPANRRLAPRDGAAPPPALVEAGSRLGASPDKYAFVRRALLDLALEGGLRTMEEAAAKGILWKTDTRDPLAPYRRDLAELAPDIRLVGVASGARGPDLVFEKRDGARLTLDDLSESEKQSLLFAATFRRVGLSRSVVLVDQPELHIHPDAQLRFARAIARLGVDNQLFFATGSQEIMRTAAQHEIISLGPRA